MNARSCRSTNVDESNVYDMPVVYEFPKVFSEDLIGLHEVKGGARVAFKDEIGATKEREVLCEAQQGRSEVKRRLFGSFRKKMGCVPRRREKVITYSTRQLEIHVENDTTDVMDLSVVVLPLNAKGIRRCKDFDYRGGTCDEVFYSSLRIGGRDEIGESKMIGLELEQETTKVVLIKARIKEAKDRQES
nr:hypothetical protein [Tanacetum cinerariifolium]